MIDWLFIHFKTLFSFFLHNLPTLFQFFCQKYLWNWCLGACKIYFYVWFLENDKENKVPSAIIFFSSFRPWCDQRNELIISKDVALCSFADEMKAFFNFVGQCFAMNFQTWLTIVTSDAMWHMDLRSNEVTESGLYPERSGEPDCSYYIRTGLCRFGATCRFNHPPNRKLVRTATCLDKFL